MNRDTGARAEILARVRAALTDVPASEQSAPLALARTYRQHDTDGREEIIARFSERVAEYKVTVRRVEARDLARTIAEICAARHVYRLVVPADVPAEWLPAESEILRDDGGRLSNEQLDRGDGVLSGCALGIAQSGTLVLDGGPAQGRRVLTLLPDYHLCVIREEQIVDLVPAAVARLNEAVGTRHRPLTFISGPSATSDIELNRVEGVHGPRTLDVLIVRE